VPGDQITVSGTAYNRLATLYCLGSNKLALTLTNADSAEGTFSITNVSTQVNYKTNIVGNIELARPVASVGETLYCTLAAAARAAESGTDKTITLLQDVTLSSPLTLPGNVTFNGNGKQISGTITAKGSITFAGHTKVTEFVAMNSKTINIPEGACLEINGIQPFKAGYGNTFNIGDYKLEQPSVNASLIIPAGIQIDGEYGNTFQIYNTRIELGSLISNVNTGTFNFSLSKSVLNVAGNVSLSSNCILTLFYSTVNIGGTYEKNGADERFTKSSLNVKVNPLSFRAPFITDIPSNPYPCHSERAKRVEESKTTKTHHCHSERSRGI
jgi:hypothetical protein